MVRRFTNNGGIEVASVKKRILMKRFEYCQVFFNISEMIAVNKNDEIIARDVKLITLLNRLGEYEWELVGIDNQEDAVTHYFLKRELE